MEQIRKIATVVVFLLLFTSGITIAGTIDTATLDPSTVNLTSGDSQSITFSAINDKTYLLQDFSAVFKYDEGLNISFESVTPSASITKINTKRRLITIEWIDVEPGIELNSVLRIDTTLEGSTLPGEYKITPSQISYHEPGNRKAVNGTCNSANIIVSNNIDLPDAPQSVFAEAVGNSIVISWSASPQSDVTTYRVYKRTAGGNYSSEYFSVNAPTLTYTDSDVISGTGYFYSVTAVNNSGNESLFSPETNEVIIEANNSGAPDAPQNVYSNVVDNSIVISWSAPPQSDITKYYIYKREAGGNYNSTDYFSVRASNLSYTDSAIVAGKGYLYCVTAVNKSRKESVRSKETGDIFLNPLIRTYGDTGKVTATGDLNGDGLIDFVIGHPGYISRKYSTGMVYIYFGGQSFTSPSVIMPGESSGHSFGNSLAVIDMDNDGYDDLIVGDPGYDADYDAGPIIGTASEAGKIYAYAGGTEFSTTPSFIMEGSFAYDCGYTGYYILTSEMIGMVMAPAGDINGDGYQDLIVGNPYAGNGRSGSIMFILGDPLFHGRSIKIDNPGCDEYMGAVVAPVGDINGDGYSDVAVGVNSTTVVFWGGTQIQRSDITLQAGAAVDGQNLLNHYTDDWDKSIAGLDFNGDGFSDIAVSSGSVISLFYGGADFDETPDLIIYGAGESVASLGDINNDGYDDLLTKQSVIFGNSNNETDVDLAFTFLSPHIPFNGIGDVDGDGIKDVITPDSKVYSLTQYWDLPGIMLTTPLPSVVHTQTIDINGSVSGNSSRFFINGTESQLTSENTFAAQTNLTLGDNKIELIAETTGSGLGKRILDVRYNDYYPLSFNSLSPSDGSTFTTRTITVSGSVNNTLQAVHVNDYDAVISYNGTIANNTFSFDFGLTGSGTRIKVTPIDVHGQSVSQSLIVYYVAPLPVINFSATPNGLNEGETTTLSWTTQNADTVSIDNGLGDQALNGSLTVSPGEPTTYTLTATGPEGTSTQSVTVGFQPKIRSLSADKIAITLGETATLSWSTSWADSVSIDQNIGTVAASGTHTVSPVTDTTYTLTASNAYGSVTNIITIAVSLPPLELSITSPQDSAILYSSAAQVAGTVTSGSTVTVNGIDAMVTDNNYTADIILGNEGSVPITVEAVGPYGQNKATTIEVIYHELPYIDLSVSNNNLLSGESVTLSWAAGNCDYCIIESTMQQVNCNGSIEVSPEQTTVYTINAYGLGKIAKDSETVIVGNSYGNPSIAEQVHLEAINHARKNPVAEALRLGIDLNEGPPSELIPSDPAQPLTFNHYLHMSAQGHTESMATNYFIAHEGLDGRSPQDRMLDAGYTGDETGENLAMLVENIPVDGIATSLKLHDNLFIDAGVVGRGHRINILFDSFKEIGIGFTLKPLLIDYEYGGAVTCNFGAFTDGPNYILGVVYDDSNGDSLYTSGEGLSSVHISVSGTDTETFTADAGGYSLPLNAGTYTVNARLSDGRSASKQFTISDQNIKTDFTLADFEDALLPEISISAESYAINQGQSARLIWSSINADEVYLSESLGYVPLTGGIDVSPITTTTYTITASNNQGSVEQSITITVLPPLPSSTLSAAQPTIWIGESAVLNWTTDHTTSCSIDNGIGDVSLDGSLSVSPEETTTYTLTAVNDQGSTTSQVMVTVEKPAASLTVDRSNIDVGESAILQWTSEFSDECVLTPVPDSIAIEDSLEVSPTETTQYTLTCSRNGVSADSSVTVYVNDYTQIPFAEISVEDPVIHQGDSTVLSWISTNATEFFIDNSIGDVSAYGQLTISPETTTTYHFVAIGPAGSYTSQVTVKVLGNPEPQPEGSFGIIYQGMVPEDATIDAYDTRRFSLIKGTIFDINDQPISGIQVTVLDQPQYGSIVTDNDGDFVLPVDGGATFTVSYAKPGYITSQRQVYVPWNDIGIVVPVQMITEDSKATVISFDGNENTVITHRSSEVADQSGTRAMTMVFKGNNRVYMIDENGVRLKELATIITRATEYATSMSMPAELPKTSAYTYCAELAVDGIERVEFDKPVVTFVDNFLGFNVGSSVPLGSYDRDRGIWIAELNGLVIELLDTNNDGIVDGLDGDGDGNADDIDGDGLFADEVAGLEDQSLYLPGATYWRAEVSHFTPWDWNWCSFQSLFNMLGYGSPFADRQLCPDGDCASTGSSVSSESQIFHEDISIPGTGLYLSYNSDRTSGYKNLISVPVSGLEVPSSVKRIVVEVHIAGQILEKTVNALPNQVVEFVWDGLDGFGNQVYQKVTAHVKTGYVYDSYYMESGYMAMSFAQFGTAITSVPTRDEIISWQQNDITINVADKEIDIAQGWSISAHHKLTPTDPTTLHKGDGSVAKNITNVITTIAGNGEVAWPQNGTDALNTPLANPISVALNPAGELFIANQVAPTIIKVDRDGITTIIAGGGLSEEDNIPATEAKLMILSDIAFDHHGNLYLADLFTCKIRKINSAGIITTVAGTGANESSGDNGPALSAGIMPNSIAVDSFGNLYIAESSSCIGGDVDPVTGECTGGASMESSYRVRKISTNGIISTIVGTGEKFDPDAHGTNGDGGPARLAYLLNPTSVSVDPYGNLYITDNVTIRKVDTSGTITTVAGTGIMGYLGDGGLATDAQLTLTSGIAFDKGGNFYFSQYFGDGDVVRKVTSNGYISTVAGEGAHGLSGDDGAATHARLMQPGRLATDPAGFIYIPDSGNKRVRKVAIDSYNEEGVNFTEPNGTGHLISAAGLHTTTYDLETNTSLLTFGYDSQKNLITITDQLNREVIIERLSDGTPTAIISPYGLNTQLTIDSYSQLTHMTYADNTTHIFEYEANDGLLTAKNEPNGNRFEHFFDNDGRVYATNNMEGGLWEFSRTKTSDGIVTTTVTTPNTEKTVERTTQSTGAIETVTTTTSGETVTSTTSADGLDSVVETSCGPGIESYSELDKMFGYTFQKSIIVTTSAGLEVISSFQKDYVDEDENGLPESVTQSLTTNGNVTTIEHDVLNSVRTATTPENRTVTTVYDPATFQTTQVSVPGLIDVAYEYYQAGHLHYGKLHFVRTGTRETEYTYYDNGNLHTVTDPELKVTTYEEYDLMNRVKRVKRPDNTTVQYEYDNNGNMTALINPSGDRHEFGYNGIDQKDSYVTPHPRNYSYQYDEDRRLLRKLFPSGKEIFYDYDDGAGDKSLLRQIVTPEGIIDYTYACGSKVETVTKDSESLTWSYDSSLVTSETLSGTLNQTLTYNYNNDGDFLIDGFTYAGGIETYNYDNDNLLTGSGSYTINHKPGNGLPDTVSGNDLSLSRAFNAYGENDGETYTVNAITAGSWSVTARDLAGRILEKTETIGTSTTTYGYTYDDNGRLETVEKDSVIVESYGYTELPYGTCTERTNTLRGITVEDLSYDEEDRLLSTGDASYTYDEDGYLTSKIKGIETTLYSYSSRGELLSVTLPNSTLIEYVHDPLGRRIAKKVNGTITEKYLWSGQTTLLAVYDGSDTLLTRFEYADGRMPVSMRKDSANYYFVYDQVGSLKGVVDSLGVAVKIIEYDSHGFILSDSDSSFTVPFGFAGGLHDIDTGLVRFGYRDYDPEVGRWTAKDPIGFAGGDTDLYGYVLNDPVNLIDPEGLKVLINVGVGVATGIISNVFLTSGNVQSYSDIGKAVGVGAVSGLAGGIISSIPKIGPTLGGVVSGGLTTLLNNKAGLVKSSNVEQSVIASMVIGGAGGLIGTIYGGDIVGTVAGIAVGGWGDALVSVIEQFTGKPIGDALKDLGNKPKCP